MDLATDRRTSVQFLQFLLVGGVNFLLTLAVYYVLLEVAKVHYQVALVSAWLVGVSFTYLVNFLWVFKPQSDPRSLRHVLKYYSSNLLSLLLNMAALAYLVDHLHWPPFAAQFLLIPLIVAFNFLAAKFWSLRAHRPEADT